MIKFLKVTSFYNQYLNHFYSKNIGIENQSYERQLESLFNDGFAWANYWKLNLENTGKFKVEEIIYNAEKIQKKWATENNFKYSKINWEKEILEAQIESFKPEIIFFEAIFGNVSLLKRKFPFIKLVISWDGIAQNNPKMFDGVDIMLSSKSETVNFYRTKNFKAFLFAFGFEETILQKIKNESLKYNSSFVGSLVISKGGHRKRLSLLHYLSKNIDVDLWLSGLGNTDLTSNEQLRRIARGLIPEVFQLRTLARRNHGEAFGIEMYQILADSKISLNTHIDVAGKEAANIRLFEATGVGSCLLTDWKENLDNYFDIDKEIVTYKTKEECLEKVIWLLNNESERKKIAIAGQKKTLENHTFRSRIANFLEFIEY